MSAAMPTLGNLFADLVTLCAAGAAAAQPTCEGMPSGVQLHLVVETLRTKTGAMTATLYANDPAQFLKGNGSLKVWRTKSSLPSTEMCIWLPHPGAYALVAYQDLNENGVWDHAKLGSIEPFGFSRNPIILFGKPSLKATLFQAGTGETTVRIRLNYF